MPMYIYIYIIAYIYTYINVCIYIYTHIYTCFYLLPALAPPLSRDNEYYSCTISIIAIIIMTLYVL